MNRRVPNGTLGGVRGQQAKTSPVSYSVEFIFKNIEKMLFIKIKFRLYEGKNNIFASSKIIIKTK